MINIAIFSFEEFRQICNNKFANVNESNLDGVITINNSQAKSLLHVFQNYWSTYLGLRMMEITAGYHVTLTD